MKFQLSIYEDLKASVEKMTATQLLRFGVLPVQANGNTKILVADFSNDYVGTSCARDFYNTLCDAGYQAEFWENPGASRLRRAAEEKTFDLILTTITNQYCFGTNVLRLHGRLARNMMDGWTKRGTPAVFLCFYDDSFPQQFAAAADTVVCTYGVVKDTHRELIKKLFQ